VEKKPVEKEPVEEKPKAVKTEEKNSIEPAPELNVDTGRTVPV